MRSRLHRTCKMNKKRYQPDVEFAIDSEEDVRRPCLKRRRQLSHSPSPALETFSEVRLRAGAAEVQERLRVPRYWGCQSSSKSSSTPKKHASAGTSHNAPPKDPGTPASQADKNAPGNNASSPVKPHLRTPFILHTYLTRAQSTFLGVTSPPTTPTATKHTHCIHCAKQLHNPSAIVYCDAQFDTSSKPTVQCWRCATDNQQCIPIPMAYRRPVNQAIALRETVDEQQGIMDRAMARRNAARKALKELGGMLSGIPLADGAMKTGG